MDVSGDERGEGVAARSKRRCAAVLLASVGREMVQLSESEEREKSAGLGSGWRELMKKPIRNWMF